MPPTLEINPGNCHKPASIREWKRLEDYAIYQAEDSGGRPDANR
jgi:hypothetical protein